MFRREPRGSGFRVGVIAAGAVEGLLVLVAGVGRVR